MMNSRWNDLSAVVLSGALLAGCAGGAGVQPGGEGGPGGATTGGAETTGGFQGNPLDDPNSPLANRTIYFAFDSSEIQPEDRELLAIHAKYLAQHPEISVVVEGHADERGSREYNLALGERRGKSVEQLMTLQGAGTKQLQVISFGEERPVAMEHNESGWSLNRRVELLYSGY